AAHASRLKVRSRHCSTFEPRSGERFTHRSKKNEKKGQRWRGKTEARFFSPHFTHSGLAGNAPISSKACSASKGRAPGIAYDQRGHHRRHKNCDRCNRAAAR